MERQLLAEFLDAGMSLEQIGLVVGRDPSTVGYWVKKHGLTAAHKARHAARGGLTRESLERRITDGASVRGIAVQLGVSEGTVRHWLRKYGLQTLRAERMQASEAAQRTEKEVVELDCSHHGRSPHILEGRGSYRCTRCRGEAVARRRRRVKEILLEEAGGRCVMCGYDRCVRALQFHHLNPSQKSFGISRGGITMSIDRARLEAAKCILVCGNCHAELEAGIATLQNHDLGTDVASR